MWPPWAWRSFILQSVLITAVSQCREVVLFGAVTDTDSVNDSVVIMEPTTSSCAQMMGRHTLCGVCSCCMVGEQILVLCEGAHVTDIPQDLPLNTTHLTFLDTDITNLTSAANGWSKLHQYKKIRHLLFKSNRRLSHIAKRAFFLDANVVEYIMIDDSPLLQEIPAEALISFYKLQTLKITHCGLLEQPKWSWFYCERIVDLIDLTGNKMVVLKSAAFSNLLPVVGTLLLDDNMLEEIEGNVFSGSNIGYIKIRRNKNLRILHEDVFANVKSLRSLDLSQTSIVSLPAKGLEQIVNLILVDVYTLKVFPSVLKFSHLESAQLTYSQHCCALAHPEKQDEKEWKEFVARVERDCGPDMFNREPINAPHPDWLFDRELDENSYVIPKSEWHAYTLDPKGTYTYDVSCGSGVVDQVKQAKCTPQADAFNPCEDVMGHVWLRHVIWVVIVTALLGNLMVLAVTLSTTNRLSVSKFLICNLALADLMLGLYLLSLATVDLDTRGVYFNHAIVWQFEGGCQTAGFLAIFSTSLSVVTLTLITFERWYAIRHAIQLTRRLRMKPAVGAMAAGWIFSIMMAILPLLGVSSYGKTSICLPMETETTVDLIYVLTLLLLSAGAFFLVCACYVDMYRQVRGDAVGAGDATVAKRMALLIFTDFACLFPLAFFGLSAAAGRPLVTMTDSKILVVLCFPLNSCANPFLYALFTKQFRHDLYGVLSRCGVCERRVNKHRIAGSGCVNTASTRNSSIVQSLYPCCLKPNGSPVLNTAGRECKSDDQPKDGDSPCCHQNKCPRDLVNNLRGNKANVDGSGDRAVRIDKKCARCDVLKASEMSTVARLSTIPLESPHLDGTNNSALRRLADVIVEPAALDTNSESVPGMKPPLGATPRHDEEAEEPAIDAESALKTQ